MTTAFTRISIFLFILILVFFEGSLWAQCNTGGSPTCTLVTGSGGSQTINKHGTCKTLTNSNSSSLMVPHNTAAEWSGASGILSNLPANVTSNNCCTSTPWGTVGHNYSNTAYSAATSSNCASISQTRTCTNGTMSGSFTFTSCSAAGTWSLQTSESCFDFYMAPCFPYNGCGHADPIGQSCSPVGTTCRIDTFSTFFIYECL